MNGHGNEEKEAASGRSHDIGAKPKTPLSVGDLHVRLIDFGSAVDKHSIEQLYGSEGPSDDEQTAEYAPPEALLARSLPRLLGQGPTCTPFTCHCILSNLQVDTFCA